MALARTRACCHCLHAGIVDHEHALLESIPDDEKPALMPIIRFVRGTLQNPCCCAGLFCRGSTPPRLLMQIHDSRCTDRDCKPHAQPDLPRSENVFCEQGLCSPLTDGGSRINGNRSSAWHLASPPCLTMSSASEALYKQVNYHGELQGNENALHHLSRADLMQEGGLLLTTGICKPNCLPSSRRKSERNISDKCSSLHMDSFDLDELRRSLQPPAHDTDSDGVDIQSISSNDSDDASDADDNDIGEEVGNNDSSSSNPNPDEEDDASDAEWQWANGMPYSQTMSSDELLQFPKVHCRRRHIVKKETGWIKKRTAMSVVSRVRHKRKCNLPCCTDCETGTKRRKASKFGSRKCARLSTMNKIMSSSIATNSEEAPKNNRVSSETRAACAPPASSDSCGKNELSHLTEELDTSFLATALTMVFKNSKSHGLTSREALRALTEGFMDGIGEYEGQELASLVKVVLKKCPCFRELKNHRFILKSTPKNTGLQSKLTLEDVTELDGRESQREVSLRRMLSSDRRETSLPQPAGQSFIRSVCPMAAGAGLQCRSTTNVNISGSAHHQQLPISAVASIGCYSAEIDDSCDTCLDRRLQDKEEDMFSTVVDSCSGQSAEEHAQEPAQPIRCCRTDGKNWQCSNRAQKGSSYCERHQSRCKKGMGKQCLNALPNARESKQLQRKEVTIQQNQRISQLSNSSMQLRPRRHVACVTHL